MKIIVSRLATQIGGAELSAKDHALVLQEMGHIVRLVTNNQGVVKKLNQKLPAMFLFWPHPTSLRLLLFPVLSFANLLLAITYCIRFRPNIVNAHSRDDQIILTLLRPFFRYRIVWKDAGDMRYMLQHQRSGTVARLYQQLYIYCACKADGVYFLNQDDLDRACDFVPKLIKTASVVSSDILFDDFTLPNQPRHTKTVLTIGTVIRLTRDKGVDVLIEAFAALLEKHPVASLVIVGDGEARKELEALTNQVGIQDRVMFAGESTNTSEWYTKFDIFVQPARLEPWGRTIKEARYFSLPVIGSATKGISQQIEDGRTGLLFAPGNVSELTHKLHKLMTDQNLRQTIAAAGHKQAMLEGDFKTRIRQQIFPLLQGPTEVLLDATPLVRSNVDGISRYASQLTAAFEQKYGDHYKFIRSGFISDNGVLQQRVWLHRKIYSVIVKLLNLSLPTRLPLGFYPNFVLFPRIARRAVVVVHDLTFMDTPNELTPKNLRYLRRFVPPSVQRANKVVVISEFTKQRLIKLLKVPASKVEVVPCGVDASVFTPQTKTRQNTFITKYGLPRNYILCFGSMEPRKNLGYALDAYEKLDVALRQKHALVIAGGAGWLNEKTKQHIVRLQKAGYDILTPGYVPDMDVPLLYACASVLLFPSRYEGFGLPIIESQSCGTPVACADALPMKQVAGKGGILFNPDQPEDGAQVLTRVLQNKTIHQKLVSAGIKNASGYSWEHSADLLNDVFESVSKEP